MLFTFIYELSVGEYAFITFYISIPGQMRAKKTVKQCITFKIKGNS